MFGRIGQAPAWLAGADWWREFPTTSRWLSGTIFQQSPTRAQSFCCRADTARESNALASGDPLNIYTIQPMANSQPPRFCCTWATMGDSPMGRVLQTSGWLLAVFGCCGVASAADIPVKAPPPPVYYNWTGFYLGVNIGGSWGRQCADVFDGGFSVASACVRPN